MARKKRTKKAANDFWADDCETDPFKYGRVPKPFIWGAYNPYLSAYHEFDTTAEYLQFCREVGGIHYAHNGGKFDWYYVVSEIDLYRPIKVINGRLAKFFIGETEFRDSYSILPVPLAAYKKQEFDYRKLEGDVRSRHLPEIKHYLQLDCVYLSEIVSAFRESHGNALTLAGAAMKFYEGFSGIQVDNTGREYYDNFAPYYAGGRVESFAKGRVEGPLTVIDINSAYPYAMKEKHPCGVQFQILDNIGHVPQDEIGRLMLKFRAESTGAFFYRSDAGLGFPNDGEVREFHATGWEYLAALETGTLRQFELIEARRFLFSRDFGPYVDHWFSLKDGAKMAGRKADELIAKLFLNSLYGKFGTNAEKYRDYQIIPEDMIIPANLSEDWEADFIFDGRALVSKPSPEAAKRYYNVATAASVTGYVRAMLWRAINTCGNVFYCDTDSIIAGDVSRVDMDARRLGAWKVEAEGKAGHFAGKKLYTVELTKPDKNGSLFKSASKGVRLDPEDIIKVASGEEIRWENDAPTFRFTKNVIHDKLNETGHNRPVAFQSRKVRLT